MADLASYLLFVRQTMGIDPKALPDASPWIATCFNMAVAIVNPTIRAIDCTGLLYDQAVYNLAGHYQIEFTPDTPAPQDYRYFAALRDKLGLVGFVPGVVGSTSTPATSSSFITPEFLKELSMSDLSLIKTYYGRFYLGIAAKAGPSSWGLS